MPRYVENPKSHIISCRINDEEMQVLQKIAEKKKTSISELLREGLGLQDKDGLRTAAVRFS